MGSSVILRLLFKLRLSKMMDILRIKMNLSHLLVILTMFSTGLSVAEWGYFGKNGPENWPGICTIGKKQSPINIVTKDTIKIDLRALNFDQYNLAFPATLNNNGHSVEIKLHGAPIYLSGGNMQSTYILEQMHFHWDAEHTVDGLRDPLEMHIVHYNNQYANISEAVQHENGIVVVAVLFKMSRCNNPYLKPIVKATKKVLYKIRKSTVIKGKLKPLLFLPKNHMMYYHYQGSLTTPECQESVKWFILNEKLTVSHSQMNVFKCIRGNYGKITFNYRPLQKLNDRKVYYFE